jgi:hypothetical protein
MRWQARVRASGIPGEDTYGESLEHWGFGITYELQGVPVQYDEAQRWAFRMVSRAIEEGRWVFVVELIPS